MGSVLIRSSYSISSGAIIRDGSSSLAKTCCERATRVFGLVRKNLVILAQLMYDPEEYEGLGPGSTGCGSCP